MALQRATADTPEVDNRQQDVLAAEGVKPGAAGLLLSYHEHLLCEKSKPIELNPACIRGHAPEAIAHCPIRRLGDWGV